jgi:excisionase family DNA binding protein
VAPDRAALQQAPAAGPPGRLLLTAAEAAQALAVSERTLWQLTRDGEIPRVCIGRNVRYSPADLQAFIERRRESAGH